MWGEGYERDTVESNSYISLKPSLVISQSNITNIFVTNDDSVDYVTPIQRKDQIESQKVLQLLTERKINESHQSQEGFIEGPTSVTECG